MSSLVAHLASKLHHVSGPLEYSTSTHRQITLVFCHLTAWLWQKSHSALYEADRKWRLRLCMRLLGRSDLVETSVLGLPDYPHAQLCQSHTGIVCRKFHHQTANHQGPPAANAHASRSGPLPVRLLSREAFDTWIQPEPSMLDILGLFRVICFLLLLESF